MNEYKDKYCVSYGTVDYDDFGLLERNYKFISPPISTLEEAMVEFDNGRDYTFREVMLNGWVICK